MKKPKISDLRVDPVQTNKIREMAAKATKIKVTFNLDSDLVNKLKALADETGGKYQTLLNRILREALTNQMTIVERMRRLEQEIRELKNKLDDVA
jgi:uncharacterized protein (DUF4415 family)